MKAKQRRSAAARRCLMSCHERIACTASCSASVSSNAAGASQVMRRNSKKPTSNHDARRSRNSLSKAHSSESSPLILTNWARILAKNFTPSGRSLNCIKRRIRGDCSVWRKCAWASSRVWALFDESAASSSSHWRADRRNTSGLTPYSPASSLRKFSRPREFRSR